MKKINLIILSLTLLFLTACAQRQIVHHWKYEGEYGPAQWDKIKPEYSPCGTGLAQSPINIGKSYKTDLDSIKFSYNETPLKIINNGHTIKVKYKPGSTITIDSESYELQQFHFHYPSEHEIEGKPYDMELHLVHINKNNELAVVGVLIEKGQHNSTIETLWKYLPEEVNKENEVSSIKINADNLMPDDKSYYRYYGSLTTPPCSEGVNWNVLKLPIEMSEAQIKKFESIIGFNSRPVKPANNRFVLEST